MSATTFTASDIIAQFPVTTDSMPVIATATSKPTYTTLTTFRNAINTNALSIPSIRGGGDLGHLSLVLEPADYLIVSGVAFTLPAHPGAAATHAAGATASEISETNRQHQILLNEQAVYLNTRQALQKQILAKVHPTYIESLRHPITQFSQVTPLQILTHLWTTYGAVSTEDLSANWTRMNTPWNPPTPIESLYSQLKVGKDFAEEGAELISDTQLQRIAYDLIQATGLFEVACREWRNKPTATKTWDAFQVFFSLADDDRRKNTATTGTTGYNANNIQELVQTELANAIGANALLNGHLEPEEPDTASATANSAVTIDHIRTLMQEILTSNSQTRNRPDNRNNRRNQTPLIAQGIDENGVPISYCWSHGITSNLRHTSCTCTRKKEGHKDEATLNNRMGGSDERQRPRPATQRNTN
jgi:hypothetical protein